MKTILVDAWNTFVTESGIDEDLHNLLERYENQKVIVTNANEEQKIELGIVKMPYEVFSLAHEPDKDKPEYFQKLFSQYNLCANNVVYFEHNEDAVASARSLGIKTLHYKKGEDNRKALQDFFNTYL